MELRRWKDILAIKTPQGRFVGYHARNLEVAEISEEVWQLLAPSSGSNSAPDLEAQEQLDAWSGEQKSFPAPTAGHKINSITLNVTQICNLHCTYCAAGGDGSFGDPVTRISVEKTLPQLKFLLAKLSPGESFQITYLGGEPLLYPEGIRLLAEFLDQEGQRQQIQIRHRIVTNGTLLTPAHCELLAQIQAHVVISVDGAQAINDRNRPMKSGASTTEAIVQGLGELAKVRNRLGSLRLSGVFGKNNLNLLEAYEFYRRFSPDFYDFNFDHDETNSEFSLPFAQELEKVAAQAYALGGEKELRKITTFDRIFKSLDQQIRILNYCGAGKNFVMIDSKNNIFPCVWSPNKASEAVGSGAYLSESKLAQFQKPLVENQGCNTCWARYLCGGGCSYVHEKTTGSKSIPAEVFCFQSRYLISLGISYYQQCRSKEGAL